MFYIILGYIAAVLIGFSLGLIGGGGSILTVPVLVYLFGIHPIKATSYSLFVVGVTSLSGLWPRIRKKQISLSSLVYFGGSSLITVLLIRKFIVPGLPSRFRLFSWEADTGLLLMVLFALLMLLSAFSMIWMKEPSGNNISKRNVRPWHLILYGIATGLITGMLGAGGGFLIIPILTFFCRLPMKTAIGTSLCIITINSLLGFATDLLNRSPDWLLLFSIGITAIAGMWLGTLWSERLSGAQLKKGFGWFVLVVGAGLLIYNLWGAGK